MLEDLRKNKSRGWLGNPCWIRFVQIADLRRYFGSTTEALCSKLLPSVKRSSFPSLRLLAEHVKRPISALNVTRANESGNPGLCKTTRAARVSPKCRKFRRRMSRFPAPYCVMGYETILFRNKETPVYVGGNHPDRPGNIHSNLCANHHQL